MPRDKRQSGAYHHRFSTLAAALFVAVVPVMLIVGGQRTHYALAGESWRKAAEAGKADAYWLPRGDRPRLAYSSTVRDDRSLLTEFESGTLPLADFTHAVHVRVAWLYLRAHPLPEAMARFIAALRAFAAGHHVPGLYHETITVAYLLLIAERLHDARELEWDAFAEKHPELLARRPTLLARYYREATLASPRARAGFVMPDLPAPD